MDRKEKVFNDFIAVTSADGTWSRDSLRLVEKNPPEDRKDDASAIEFFARQNRCARAVFDAYIEGRLDGAGFTGMAESTVPDHMLLDLALRASDLPDDVWEVLDRDGMQSPCEYSNCLPVSNLRMRTYRDICGCVGRSWETVLVEGLSAATASDISDIARTYGNYPAALAVLKVYGVDGVDTEIEKFDGLTESVRRMLKT